MNKLKPTKKEMLSYISGLTQELGQIPLPNKFGFYTNLMWDDDQGVLLQTMVKPSGYIFPKLSDRSYQVVKAVYDDLKKDFA